MGVFKKIARPKGMQRYHTVRDNSSTYDDIDGTMSLPKKAVHFEANENSV